MRAKKFIILYAVVLFLVVFAVTFNCICAIARFDVTYEIASMSAQAQRIQTRLEEEYGGKSYLFFGQEDAESIVLEEGNGYLAVTGFSKTFPNVIHLRVEEKQELISLHLGNKYYAIDEEHTVLSINDAPVNNVSGNNVAIYGIEFAAAEVGDTLTVAAKDASAFDAVLRAYAEADKQLGGARGNVEAIRFSHEFEDEGLQYAGEGDLYISMREGVSVWILNVQDGVEEKIALAMQEYLSLSDAERTYGYITVANAQGPADYSPEKPNFSVTEEQ